MSADLHCSSDRHEGNQGRGKTASHTLMAAMLCLLLGGCATSGLSTSALDTKTTASTANQPVASDRAEKKAEPFVVGSTSRSEVKPYKTAHCRYLEAEAGAEATILASPTLGASSDDEGSYSINLGMNLLDFKKAELVRQTSEEKCRQTQSLKRIEISLKLVNESVAYAAAQAKHDFISRHTGDLSAISSAVDGQVAAGQMTSPQGATIKQHIRSLKADAANAKSEADKRRNMPSLEHADVARQGHELRLAEDRLQRINEQMRTLDAFKVNVEAGYRNVEGDALLNSNSVSDDLYAKVNLGVRLGALSADRRDYERLAAEARAEALDEEQQGVLWASTYGAKATRDALAGLQQSERELTRMLTEARRNRDLVNSSDRADLIGARLSARVEIISIGARLAETRAAISQLKAGSDRLGAINE